MNMLSQIIIELTDETDAPDDAALEMRALRLLDEEVRDAANELTVAQSNLADMTTAYKSAQNNLTDIVSQIQRHEGYAVQALNQENHGLAMEVAEKIAAATSHHAQECVKLTDMLHQNEHNLYVLKQQIDTIKANQSVHRAQVAVCERYGELPKAQQANGVGGVVKLRTALDALGAMKAKKSVESQPFNESVKLSHSIETADNLSVQSGFDKADDLMAKLQAAGIASGSKKAEDVLTGIKNKH